MRFSDISADVLCKPIVSCQQKKDVNSLILKFQRFSRSFLGYIKFQDNSKIQGHLKIAEPLQYLLYVIQNNCNTIIAIQSTIHDYSYTIIIHIYVILSFLQILLFNAYLYSVTYTEQNKIKINIFLALLIIINITL